ncbi:MAG: NYN domain-containing protein [Bacilli bacterium]|nr:NYN domain-containing protein [Bacilli bacterium]
MDFNNRNIALLIDSENISTKYLPIIIDEANKYGKINYKRVYGDWSSRLLNPWKAMCMEYGLTPVQQYSYTSGKNASDFTLVIDAMDILYKGKVDSFCIVSSDSDFTKLVTRLKEDNMFVFGMGESKTPLALVNSCETFAYLDKMLSVDEEEEKKEAEKEETKPQSKKKEESSITPLEIVLHELKSIIKETSEDDGWSYWANVAQLFQRKYPGFHPRNYGENIKALSFFKKRNDLMFEQRKSSIYVKIK